MAEGGRGGGAGEIFKCQKNSQLSKKIVIPPSSKKKTAIPPPLPHDGKMEVEVNDRKSDKKHEWEKYLYPFPKTERMVYYNKVVKDICETCHRLKPQTYIREQQSFRWNTKVKLHELNKAVQ